MPGFVAPAKQHQLFAIGDTETESGWEFGLHGLLAIVVLLAAVSRRRNVSTASPSGEVELERVSRIA